MDECLYSPEISPGNDDLTPVSATIPTLVTRSTIVFSHATADSVTLRNPVLGNTLEMRYRRIVNVSRGNTIRFLRRQTWPKTFIHNLKFTALSQDNVDDLRTFLIETVGQRVGYLDYESRQWTGLIVNPDTPIVQNLNDCGYSVDIIFDGVLE